jgi:hypothetical protein
VTKIRTLKGAAGLDDRIWIEAGMFDRDALKRSIATTMPLEHLAGTDRNEVGKRCFCHCCLEARLPAGPGSFPKNRSARHEQNG